MRTRKDEDYTNYKEAHNAATTETRQSKRRTRQEDVRDKKTLNIMSTFNKWPSSTGVSRLFHWGWWQNLSAQFELKNLLLKLTQFCTTLHRPTGV